MFNEGFAPYQYQDYSSGYPGRTAEFSSCCRSGMYSGYREYHRDHKQDKGQNQGSIEIRIRHGKNPFEPDRNHIHHKLLAVGLTPRQAMIGLLCTSCVFSAANIFLMPYIDNTCMLLADIIIWTVLNIYLDKIRDKRMAEQPSSAR